jgi:hypothetical protein
VVELGVREKYHRRYAQPHVLEFGPRSSCTTSVRGVRSCIWSSWLVARPKTKTKMRFSSICSSSSIQHVISADCIITSMYNDAYATAFTNNPFISDPTNAQSRFPDLSNPSNDNQYTHWIQSLPNPYYQQQQQPQQQQRQQPQQPQQYGSNFQSRSFHTITTAADWHAIPAFKFLWTTTDRQSKRQLWISTRPRPTAASRV